MDAQGLFKQGIAAIREHQDTVQGQQYLLQSLRLDPHNEMAWLWLSHTYSDPKKQIACLDRVLRLNPQNERALARKRTLLARPPDVPLSTAPQAETISTTHEVRWPVYASQTRDVADSVFAPTDADPFGLTTSSPSPAAAPRLEMSAEDRHDFKRLFLSRGSKAAITVEETLHRRGFDWNTAHTLTMEIAREATHEAERKNGLTHLIMGSMVIVVALGLSFFSIKFFQALGCNGYVVWIGALISGCGEAGYGIKLLYLSMSD